MRKTKAFKIDGHDTEITVNELTVKEIISLMQDDTLSDTSMDTLKKVFEDKVLPLCVKDLSMNDLMGMAPSEIELIWDKFAEVNKSFLALARKSGLIKSLDGLKQAMMSDFSNLLVDSSKTDIVKS